ncbi:MAG: triose-phosphate isomerase [Clostridia bacterium]|nr:triose-phosphate isomerase [Clostridia bacterium]
MSKLSVNDIPVRGKRVLVRVDFNVPLDENLNITDESRIKGALPTVRYLVENGAKTILCSHLGRPKGAFVPEMSLAPVAKRLAELMPETKVKFAKDIIGDDAKAKASALKEGEVLLLENLRFHKEEEKNDPEFAKALASYADVYVSDAFGTVHRAHASTEGVAHFLPAVSGFLIDKELSFMGGALSAPERPFVAILGGKKVGDKIGVIKNLLNKCDTLLIGGAMSYTFFKAMGKEIGDSLLDEDNIELAKNLLDEAKAKGVKMLLPVDCVVGKEFAPDTEHMTVAFDAMPAGYQGLDIGEKTAKLYGDAIREAKTVVWNGPMGVFEMDAFSKGTEAVARACADCDGITIIGGGDSASAINKFGLGDMMSHISTGGGASLEFLEGKTLPGVAALMDRPERRILVAGNWKMNKNRDEAKELIDALKPLVKDAKCDVVVCPPFVDLCCAHKHLEGSNIRLGAQNIHWAAKGAFTGEISADMLKNIGVEYAIIGHSERRQHFGETDESVNMRTKTALENGIIPIVCVGETLEQREAGITDEFLATQVRALYSGIDEAQAANIIVAYEPIWAIGTGKTATNEEANRTIGAIRKVIAELYSIGFAQNTRILYGGSMNPKNAASLKAMPEIDGGLIGGASLVAEDFAQVVLG